MVGLSLCAFPCTTQYGRARPIRNLKVEIRLWAKLVGRYVDCTSTHPACSCTPSHLLVHSRVRLRGWSVADRKPNGKMQML